MRTEHGKSHSKQAASLWTGGDDAWVTDAYLKLFLFVLTSGSVVFLFCFVVLLLFVFFGGGHFKQYVYKVQMHLHIFTSLSNYPAAFLHPL